MWDWPNPLLAKHDPMWKWPKRLLLLSLVLFFGGMALGYASDDPNGENGIAAVIQPVAIVIWISAFPAFGLAVLVTFAALFNQPGKPQHWRWQGVFATLAYLGWLLVCFVIWLGAHTGGGGLDGPCFGAGVEEPPIEGNCRAVLADWPPLSTQVIVEGPEGHYEKTYPSTVGLIVIVALALAPLAVWPLARWLTKADERRGSPPVLPLAWLVGGSLALGFAYSLAFDDETLRPLTSAERAELADNSQPTTYVPPTAEVARVQPLDVARVVARDSGAAKASCVTPIQTGIALWTCTMRTADHSVLNARVKVNESGTYEGVYVDRRGYERPLSGCCVPVAPGR